MTDGHEFWVRTVSKLNDREMNGEEIVVIPEHKAHISDDSRIDKKKTKKNSRMSIGKTKTMDRMKMTNVK